MITKKVSELGRGDTVVTENGDKVRIISINNGMIYGTKLLQYSNGEYGNLNKDLIIEVFPDEYSFDEVLEYICDTEHCSLNYTSDEFKSLYESLGFERDKKSGLFTHPTIKI